MNVTALMQAAVAAACFPAGLASGLHVSLRYANRYRAIPTPELLSPLFDSGLRMRYRDPAGLLGACGIAAGETVVDVGCGTGTFTVEMAHLIGPRGVVHAVDIQRSMLERTANRLARSGLDTQVHYHLCDAKKLPISSETVNMVVMVATLGEMNSPRAAIAEMQRVIKPGGRLVISEERLNPTYVPRRRLRLLLTDTGFQFAGRESNMFSTMDLYLRI